MTRLVTACLFVGEPSNDRNGPRAREAERAERGEQREREPVRTQIFPCSAASVLPVATRHRLCVLFSNLQRSLIASASSSATCTLLAQFLLPPSPPPNVVLPWLLQHTTARRWWVRWWDQAIAWTAWRPRSLGSLAVASWRSGGGSPAHVASAA